MLSSEHSIIEYRGSRAFPDRLTRRRHATYVGHARRMLDVYRAGKNKTREQLHKTIDRILAREPDCPARRVGAFKKLLDDASTYQTDPDGVAASLRLQVFNMAAEYHPLVTERDLMFESTEPQVKEKIAHELGRPWDEIEALLYADVISLQPLIAFDGYEDEGALLSQYNVAQVQAALYRAERMRVVARQDFRRILRHAKFARLMTEIRRRDDETYVIELQGPASILMKTRRYGVNFARFAAGLIACRSWQADASLRTPWDTRAVLRISSDDGLRSHLPPAKDYDSSVEEAFAHKFGDEPRGGWTVSREGAILHHRQTTFVPDFLFRHVDGTEVSMEIVGFWTPEYLEKKRATIRKFRDHRILLAVPEASLGSARLSQAAERDDVVVYKTKLAIAPVLRKLDRARNA